MPSTHPASKNLIIYTHMKKTNSKIAASVEGYNAPKVRVITVKVEGIICQSTENGINWFSDDDDDLNCQ